MKYTDIGVHLLTKNILVFSSILIFLYGCNIVSSNYSNYKKIQMSDVLDAKSNTLKVVQINKRKESLAELISVNDDVHYWELPNEIKLSSIDFKIIDTNGLDYDFKIYNLNTHESYLTFKNPKSSFLEILYEYEVIEKGFMNTRFNMHYIEYSLVKEVFNVPEISWKGENYYWIDNNNKVWQTKQMLDPFGTYISTYRIEK
jgi:hypothetical protein